MVNVLINNIASMNNNTLATVTVSDVKQTYFSKAQESTS